MKLRSPLAFCAIAAAMMAPAQLSAQEIPNRSAKADLISYAPAFPALLEEASIEPAGWFFAHEKDHSFDSVPIPIAPAAYRPHTFIEQASDIKWRVAAAFGATLALGFVDWDWGNSSFHFAHEGYFGKNTANGGMDKLGHAFGTMLLADFFSRGIQRKEADDLNAQITGAILAMGVMTTVEVFDGFSPQYGFSYQDIVFDGIGAGISMIRNSVPGLREKLDYRLEYIPSGHDRAFAPHSDYSGQKYVLALKLSGFEGLEDTPLRFVELQGGYFARGFTQEERDNGDSKRREPYLAVGLNLSELLLSGDEVRRSRAGRIARTSLEYIQVPYTYIATQQN